VLAISPRRVVILRGNPVSAKRLRQAGCFVYELPGEEIAFKGSGGPTCLTPPCSVYKNQIGSGRWWPLL